ncbi:hypothetical protein E4U21_002921, partial [Claviceps maximensis]
MSSSASTAAAAAAGSGRASPRRPHLWLVTGPAGCGKTTVAEYLAKALDIPYLEGDL